MKIVCISDTHTFHKEITLPLPEGDVLVHAGDVSLRGTIEEVDAFLDWFSGLPFKHKIFCAGNHDFFFDTKWKASTEMGQRRHKHKIFDEAAVKTLLARYPGVTYLEDSGIEIDGIKFWGSPVSPWFHDWGFNRIRGNDIKTHWDLIPKDTNVLITHGPICGIHDRVANGEIVGCEELLKTIPTLPDLKLHVCGHIHEAYGIVERDGVTFINASTCTLSYNPDNKPFVFEI